MKKTIQHILRQLLLRRMLPIYLLATMAALFTSCTTPTTPVSYTHLTLPTKRIV